jgi:hypothetical protein
MASLLLHKTAKLKSLSTFNKTLPEFSEVPSKIVSVVDKAFHKSLVSNVTDVKEWKPIRDEALNKQPQLTPRELARFKFSLCYRGERLVESYLGRPALHQWLDEKALNMLPHMNSIELFSLLTGYSSTMNEKFYVKLMNHLVSETKCEEDLNVLATGMYVVNSFYPVDKTLTPLVKSHVPETMIQQVSQVLVNRLLDRVTELTDDQFATICSGISRVGLGYKHIETLYPLTDALQEDLMHRRINRMSFENLIDVTSGFFWSNLAQDNIAKPLVEKILEKKEMLSYDNGFEVVQAINARQPCPEVLVKKVNELIKDGMASEDYMRITDYIFNTQCKDEELISKHLKFSLKNKPFPVHHFEALKKHQYYLKKYFKHLINDDFTEALARTGYLFDGQRLFKNTEIYENEHFLQVKTWIKTLGFENICQHLHNGHEIIDFAIKPQMVAIQVALPKYHLIGKWEEDTRIIKEPKRKFKIANHFDNKSRWLELLGFKVIRLNYQEMSENAETKGERDKNFMDFLKPLGIERTERKKFSNS